MPYFQNIVLEEAKLDVIAVEAFVLYDSYDRYNKETSFHSRHYPKRVTRKKDQVFFKPVFGQDH